jgi:hypothetical protein
MQTIATAVQAYRVKNRLADYSSIDDATDPIGMLAPDLGTKVICPTNGDDAYGVDDASTAGDDSSYKVTCTNADHGSFTPGVDGD